MVQFNLLPDVKLQFIKARRLKRMMILASVAVIGLSLLVFIFMITTVNIFQKRTLSNLNNNIKSASSQLQSTPDLSKILTVQNQLNTLSGLHGGKAVGSRVFNYLTQLTPKDDSISKLGLNFTAYTISIDGEAPRLDAVNTFTDTLKQTTYTTADKTVTTSDKKHAFTNVVLSSFGRDDKGAKYTITATFDPVIFSNSSDVTLIVPAGPTADPAALFQKQSGGA